jgi:GH25 family lysozyme M1 (1,4-beta-N-acetylmuramidase)/uncharacterized protein YgiM (DUF1202 family)
MGANTFKENIMANVIGPDVSFYQDDPETPQGIDFVKMKLSAGYVIIRAGQNLWVDSDFKANWREAKLAGIPRGSYWFYDSRIEPKRQAELWVQQFGNDFGELPLFADFEEDYKGAYKGWKHWYTFLERLKALVNGKEIAIYTGYYYWRDNAPNAATQAAELAYFHQYPLWIANYGATQPLVPKPWTANEWLFWQYTETGDGKLYGVESNGIDLNYFNGDEAALKIRFNLSDVVPPPPDDTDPDEGTPTGKMYRVTAQPSLKVREGPGLTYASIGLLYPNETVEEIGANSDRTWLRVRKADGSLKGWSFAVYLQSTDVTPPPEDTKKYRVTSTTLQVLDAPNSANPSVGVLYFGEIVEEIGANADRTWLNIRKLDGSLTGWSLLQNLISADTLPDDVIVPDPIPTDADKKWYRVGVATLSVRETAGLNGKLIGTVLLDDTLPAIDETSTPGWIQIRRVDGLLGWCEKKSLVFLSNTRPTSIRQNLFKGVTYLQKDLTTPRKNKMHVMAIDLTTAGLEFLVTPSTKTNGTLCTRTTSKFLEEFSLFAAINGDGFSYLDASVNPATTCPNGGDPVKANGFAASRGKVYSPIKTVQPIVYIGARNQVAVNGVQNQPFNAISGDRLVVEKGVQVKNLAAATPSPRTAVGVNKNGRWLIFMVVDGRQTDYSEGATFPELADLLISYGVYTGVNMDGGGSSAMVIKGILDGKARLLNSPIDQNIKGKERLVANHLGLYLRK